MTITRKLRFLIIISFSFSMLSGCIDTFAHENEKIIQNLNQLLKDIDYPNTWDEDLSPDGKFLATDAPAIDKPLKVISNISGKNIPINNLNSNFGTGMSVGVWSPDSTKIAALATDKNKILKCPYDRVVILHLQEIGVLKGYVFPIPLIEKIGCIFVTWSPDSRKLLIYNNDDVIYVVDQFGGLIKTISVAQNSIIQPLWTSKGIFLSIITYHGDSNNESSEIRMINPDTFEETILLSDNEEAINLHAISPDGRRLLLALGARSYEERLKNRFWIYDIGTRVIVKQLELEGNLDYHVHNSVETLPWVSYQLFSPEGGNYRQLLLFDWKGLEFRDYGQITRLIGWRSSFKGFLVINGDIDNYHVDVIIP